ncbi:uncharacterized protein LOC120484925 [Pimephales promelas]|uniref:uncharacterized protein LOC120484925 n=1 Tax=Pimephales promelas TaxID=90988 RepID=UPI001955CD4D|nr:uncharacterized protein LOC120484925 [Pimephales promelas]
MGKGKRKRRPVCLSSSDEELGGAGPDHPSSVPLPPPVPENLQPQAPHSLNTRPFIQPPSIPLTAVAPERPSRVLQDASSAFRDLHLPPPVPENPQPEDSHLHRTRPFIQPFPPATPLTAVTPDRPNRVLQGASPAFRDAMFARLLTILEEIKETQRVHGRMIQSLLTQRDASTVAALPEDIVFPLRTVSDVDVMEQKLADPTFHKRVVDVVAEIGGRTVDEATRRMMAFLLDHPLSRQYNFVGRHGKREFGGLKLFEVVYGSLKKNPLTNQINRREAEKAVSKWLIGARDRGGNRTARARGGEQDRAVGRATTDE